MNIRFCNIKEDEQHKKRHRISFEESEQIRGDLEVEFKHDGTIESFRQSDINVPLVVAETKKFLDDLDRSDRATWRLCFAPFVKGRKETGNVILFTGTPADPEGGVVQVLTRKQLQNLRSHLSTLQWRYGRLVPTRDE